MNSLLTRRTLLTAAPALASTPVAALARVKDEQDRHPAWLNAFIQNENEWLAANEGSEEEKRLWGERDRLEALICLTPATTIAGLAAQLEFLVRDAKDYWCCPVHGELAESAVKSAKALAAAHLRPDGD